MKCKICGNTEDNKVYQVREMLLGYKEIFSYFECSRCNCLQIKDIPQNILKYYPHNYYSYQSDLADNGAKRFLIKLRDKYALFGKGVIGKYLYDKFPREDLRSLYILQLKKNAKILDVGCGAGNLLYSLRELGMKNLLGIDPYNKQMITYDNGLTILKKDIHDVEGKWDIVMFHHSFEHISTPSACIKTVSELLSPNGCCIIRIPVTSSYAWRHYGVNWVQLDAPRHFFLHSINSINILASQAGLDTHKVVYDSTSFQFWGSEQYLKDIPLTDELSYSRNPKNSIFSKEQISDYAMQANALNEANQGDQAIFYLRKRG